MDGKVYVVHCVDTEGPLYQDTLAIFKQLKNIFGISIEPSQENLKKLQEKKINLDGKEEAVQNLVDKQKISTKGSWQEIDDMLNKITSKEFRNKLLDSEGNGWIYNWFCMDHVGFTGANPRKRDAGHHRIFDHYNKIVNEQKLGDIIQFHHHPVSFSGNYNDSGTAYWGSGNLNQILCRKIIDRQWFPTAFRPGFHTERPDSHWFLEQWIPFDYGNQSIKIEEYEQQDLAGGRFGDWRYAPIEWYPYHPSYDNYQMKGNCRRWITRCLNMYSRIRQLTLEDVREAFLEARNGKNVILSFTDHDYKDMIYEINYVRDLLAKVSEEFKDVKFQYVDAITAMRESLNLEKKDINLKAQLIFSDSNPQLIVECKNGIFGTQPYLAIKTYSGKYYWDNFDFSDKNTWSYTFDNNTVDIAQVESIGIAANNDYGNCKVIIVDPKKDETKRM